jgi:hypothetical protein
MVLYCGWLGGRGRPTSRNIKESRKTNAMVSATTNMANTLARANSFPARRL